MKKLRIKIEGMTCEHCEATLKKALEGVGVMVLKISYREGMAVVSGDVGQKSIKEVIKKTGYRAISFQEIIEEKDGRFQSGHLVVLGSGSAGFAAAIRARELGVKVTMITGTMFGGTCVNVGCVPSKFLIHRASVLHSLKNPPPGLNVGTIGLDMEELQKSKEMLIGKLLEEKYMKVAEAWDIELKEGVANFISNNSLKVNGETVPFNSLIVATGAKPWIPPIEGLEEVGYWTSTEALETKRVPDRLAVIGANAVGLELAQAFKRLGSKVTVVEAQPRIVPFEEKEIGDALERILEREGMKIFTGIRIKCVEKTNQGKRILCQGDLEPIDVDEIIVATGRRPNTDGLGLDVAGVERDERGAIIVDEHLRTSNPRVFAAGDVTPHPQFVYLASRMGQIAAENALGRKEIFDPSLAPRVTFTDPQVASVGLTEEVARNRGFDVKTSLMDLSPVARARIEKREGLLKMVADRRGKLLGIHILSPQAGEVIYAAHLALMANLKIKDFVKSFAPYLTYSEGLRLVAQTFKVDIHKLSCCA